MSVEERLLLDGVALRSGDVPPGDVERSALIVANLADAGLTLGNGATVAAGKTADAILVEPLVQMGIGFADSLIENCAEGEHGFLATHSTADECNGDVTRVADEHCVYARARSPRCDRVSRFAVANPVAQPMQIAIAAERSRTKPEKSIQLI
jgi:hypothetical protein